MSHMWSWQINNLAKQRYEKSSKIRAIYQGLKFPFGHKYKWCLRPFVTHSTDCLCGQFDLWGQWKVVHSQDNRVLSPYRAIIAKCVGWSQTHILLLNFSPPKYKLKHWDFSFICIEKVTITAIHVIYIYYHSRISTVIFKPMRTALERKLFFK